MVPPELPPTRFYDDGKAEVIWNFCRERYDFDAAESRRCDERRRRHRDRRAELKRIHVDVDLDVDLDLDRRRSR